MLTAECGRGTLHSPADTNMGNLTSRWHLIGPSNYTASGTEPHEVMNKDFLITILGAEGPRVRLVMCLHRRVCLSQRHLAGVVSTAFGPSELD